MVSNSQKSQSALSRLLRVLKLLELLWSGQQHTAESLAEATCRSRRTVFRDLNLLRQAGFNIDFNPDRAGFQINLSPSIRGFGLTPDDVLALLLCARTSPYEPFVSDRIGRASGHLINRLPMELRRTALRLIDSCQSEGIPPQETNLTIATLLDGIRLSQQVRVRYDELDGSNQSTKVAPYRLSVDGQDWKLVGRSSLHRQVVEFHVHRIRAAELTTDIFERPHSIKTAGAWRNSKLCSII